MCGVVLAASAFFSSPSRGQQSQAATPAVVQPGAPGKPSKTLPASTKGTLPPLSQEDVEFMQGMIMHHAQAVEMTALIPSHTENKELRELGAKISSSQADEIKFMQRWLAARGQATSMSMAGMPDMGKSGQPIALMPGMLTPEQMEALRKAKGAEFDRLIFDGDDSAPQRCADYGQGSVRHGRRGARCGDIRLRNGCGQYTTGGDQDYAGYVGKRPVEEKR